MSSHPRCYNYHLVYRTGTKNQHADALSRLPLPKSTAEWQLGEVVMLLNYLDSSPVNAEDIAEVTRQDPILSKVKRFTESGWSKEGQQRDHFEPYRRRQAELSVEQDCLLLGQHVIVPTRL